MKIEFNIPCRQKLPPPPFGTGPASEPQGRAPRICYARIGRSGGALKLLNLSPLHLSLMVLTKLEAEFEVFTDEQDAVDSFFPDRPAHHYDILEWIQEQEKRPAPDLPK